MYILKRELKLEEEQKTLIRNKVSSLPILEREVIDLYFWKQYSHFQIARNLGLSVNNTLLLIETAMFRLRGDLLELAGEYFETFLPSKNLNFRRT